MRSRPLNKRTIDAIDQVETTHTSSRVNPAYDSSDEDVDDEQIAEYLRNKRNKIKHLSPQQAGKQLRVSLETDGPATLTDSEYESSIAFCCSKCNCSKKIKSKFQGKEYMQASAELVHWHRACCHHEDEQNERWVSPYIFCLEETLEQLLVEPCNKCKRPNELCKFCKAESLEKKGIKGVDAQQVFLNYMENNGSRKGFVSEDFYAGMNNGLHAKPEYISHLEKFRLKQSKARTKPLSKAVVLDLFGGIGSAIVALRRLNIDIKKVVHVEHDKVANYVYKYWNTLDGKQHDDEIEHVFIHSFEMFQRNFDHFLHKHGPFNIVVGAPPYIHYDDIDSSTKAIEKKPGSYLIATGAIVRDILRHQKFYNYRLFFLVESTAIFKDREDDVAAQDLEQILEAFGIGWHLTLDSKDHTPLQRKRVYITNIPLVRPLDQLDPPARLCFDDGYDLIQSIFDPEKEEPKVPCLLTNKNFLDDHPRMSIYKQHGSRQLKLYRRTPTATERERLMGLPPGYVSEPVEKLFTTLVSNGFAPEAVEVNRHWMDCLPEEFHEFAGDYHGFNGRWPPFQFYTGDSNDPDPTPCVKLKLAPPLSDKKPQYFTEEQYAKRLIGNSFSIPTLEFLLRPLTPFFMRRQYASVDYNFAWAEWDPANEKPPVRSELVKSLIREVTRKHGDKKPRPSVIRNGIKPTFPLTSTVPFASREAVDRLSLSPASALKEEDRTLFAAPQRKQNKSTAPRSSINPTPSMKLLKPSSLPPASAMKEVERRFLATKHQKSSKLRSPLGSTIPLSSRQSVDQRPLSSPTDEVDRSRFAAKQQKRNKPAASHTSITPSASRESVDRLSSPSAHAKEGLEIRLDAVTHQKRNKPMVSPVLDASRESVDRLSLPQATAGQVSTIPFASTESVGRLSLPPASAMEEVDRTLLAATSGFDEDDERIEDIDV